jgi:hypothetical protein
MLNFEVYDAEVHDFYIQYSLIDIRHFVVVKTEIYYLSCTLIVINADNGLKTILHFRQTLLQNSNPRQSIRPFFLLCCHYFGLGICNKTLIVQLGIN